MGVRAIPRWGLALVLVGLVSGVGAAPAAAASTLQSQLVSVACTSPTSCFAAGYSINAAGTFSTLIERWDGTAWTIVPTSTPGMLHAIACAGPKSCFAVGTSPTTGSIVERWNGTEWSPVATPSPAPGVIGFLNGVACAGPKSCYAVGTSQGSSLVEKWDGTAWTVVPSPNRTGATATYLFGVSCTSPRNCNAVGFAPVTGAVPGGSPVIEHWDGTTWTLVPSPDLSGPTPQQLLGIACPTTTCFAVGVGGPSPANNKIVEQLSAGTWAVVDTTALPASELDSIACASASSCFAVGGTAENTLIERRNGKRWTVQPSPNPPGTTGNTLSGISCPNATSCLAVGQSGTNTLAERWNGKTWTIVPSANVPTT